MKNIRDYRRALALELLDDHYLRRPRRPFDVDNFLAIPGWQDVARAFMGRVGVPPEAKAELAFWLLTKPAVPEES